jgi:hypothetical protein
VHGRAFQNNVISLLKELNPEIMRTELAIYRKSSAGMRWRRHSLQLLQWKFCFWLAILNSAKLTHFSLKRLALKLFFTGSFHEAINFSNYKNIIENLVIALADGFGWHWRTLSALWCLFDARTNR